MFIEMKDYINEYFAETDMKVDFLESCENKLEISIFSEKKSFICYYFG